MRRRGSGVAGRTDCSSINGGARLRLQKGRRLGGFRLWRRSRWLFRKRKAGRRFTRAIALTFLGSGRSVRMCMRARGSMQIARCAFDASLSLARIVHMRVTCSTVPFSFCLHSHARACACTPTRTHRSATRLPFSRCARPAASSSSAKHTSRGTSDALTRSSRKWY
jgi:hypothetical protein